MIRDNIEWILSIVLCALFVVGFVLGATNSYHKKKQECEDAGGIWLTRNSQCLSKGSK